MGVAEHFREHGYKILWPIKSPFVDGLNRAYPNVLFIPDDIIDPNIFNLKEDKVINGLRIIPIRWSDRIVGKESKYWMRTKYDLYNLDYTKWKDHAGYKRDKQKEYDLMCSFELNPGEKYNLVNQIYKSSFAGNVPINVNNGLRNIEMTVKTGYSIFDWSLLIEQAENIYVVNSAIFYLLELLTLQAKEVHLYSRHPDEKGFPYVDYLMTKDYILHE